MNRRQMIEAAFAEADEAAQEYWVAASERPTQVEVAAELSALQPSTPVMFCIDCGVEIALTDIDAGVALNGVWDGRCMECLVDVQEPASDVPMGEGRRVW